ncbi:MAG: Peptidoglycan-associated lipoprotein [uncultured bacterium]|nr:MAG: Peptidoglycan-associated lipoprotein [uncultured bacterium]
MKLKKLLCVIGVGCIIALSACSTTKKNKYAGSGDDSRMMTADAGGAHSSGLGENTSYGGQGAGTRSPLVAQRTYYFDFDKSDVHEEDKPAILANADYLVAHPHTKIILEGHTDPRGSREYNVGLGEHRANAVLDLLKSRGVNPKQIRVVSYGAERPAVSGRTEQDYQLDRRAIIAKSTG